MEAMQGLAVIKLNSDSAQVLNAKTRSSTSLHLHFDEMHLPIFSTKCICRSGLVHSAVHVSRLDGAARSYQDKTEALDMLQDAYHYDPTNSSVLNMLAHHNLLRGNYEQVLASS